MATTELQEASARIDGLLSELEAMGNPVSDAVEELVALITDLYGEGLRRALAEAEPGLSQRLAGDELVAGLLVLHGLHPESLQDRVRAGLAEASATLRPAGARVRRVTADPDSGRVEVALAGPAGAGRATRDRWAETVRRALAGATPEAVVEVTVSVPLPLSAGPAPSEPVPPTPVAVSLGSTRANTAGVAAG